MKVVLTQDARVLLPQGLTIEVSEAEGERLLAFGLAEEAPKLKKTKKKED